jgi:signal transduction histidine kinase
MPPKPGRHQRILFLAFAAVVMAFIVATLFANWRALDILSQTRDVTTNAAPSIEHIVAANDALRDLEVASVAYEELAEDQRAGARRAMDDRWRRIDAELATYLTFPCFLGERELYATVPAKLRDLSAALQDLLREVDAEHGGGSHARAEGRVRESAALVADDFRRLIGFNVSHLYESAARIETLRERAASSALWLDGVAALVALTAAASLARLFRIHTRLLGDHTALIERRATELEGFGRRVAHDLLSPITAVTYCLTAFKRVSEKDPALEDALLRARACVKRTQGMVDGIFEFCRSGGRPEEGASTPLVDVLEQVADEVLASELPERPEVRIEVFPLCAIACSRGVLTSIVTNLMRNAAKYMVGRPVRRLTVRARATEEMVYIEVEDTGPGIEPELHEMIFEPYVRADGTTQPGLGLGLATVKRLCLAHGGQVGVRSVVGQGTILWLTLPRSHTEEPILAPERSPRLTALRRVS